MRPAEALCPSPLQVFQLFSTLVVSSAEARGSGSGGGGGTRLEDELHVVISKQMSSADPRHKRIGIIGTVAHIRQLASGDVTSRSAESAVEAIRMLVHMMAACQGKPACLCFLYDELSNLLEVAPPVSDSP